MKTTEYSKKHHRAEKNFRNFNFIIFALISIVMMIIMTVVVSNITKKVSSDYAGLYAENAIGTLNTHLNREITLVSKAVNTSVLGEWFEDENNGYKRRQAYKELMSYIEILYSSNVYFAIDKSGHEFSMDENTTYREFVSYATLDEDRPEDQWYFECIASDNDYVLNVDIDKQKQRKLVWINHKVISEKGEVLGVFSSGLKFDQEIENLFKNYETNSVWGIVIDEQGIVQIDSSVSEVGEKLIFNNDRHITEYYDDPIVGEIINDYLENINGVFESADDPKIFELSDGKYDYMSIAPIEATQWTVITFYNSGSLFGALELYPLIMIMLAFFVAYMIMNSLMSHQAIFLPIRRLMESIDERNQEASIFGIERKDEVGDLARTIQDMEKRLNDSNIHLQAAMEESEKANQAKSTFLANMSHEMRTPLNAVIGISQIISRTEDVERIRGYMNKIENASVHLLGVINDILDMSKIEAGKMVLETAQFNLITLLHNIAGMLEISMEKKHIKFELVIDENIPQWVKADDKHLSQILVNLLSNAVKFTSEGGTVTLAASLLEAGEAVCKIQFDVIDDGIGISEEEQGRLFQYFEQADSSISRKYGGTGLGLAISKSLVQALNGELYMESQSGKGSHFYIIMQMEKASEPEQKEQELQIADNANLAGKKVLLVEDVEINRDIIIDILDDTGIIIECAENGKQAVDAVTQDPDKFDMILMDLQMPIMDGYTATKEIRECKAAKDIPIIAMTANVYSEDIEKCFAVGMNAHLAKPIDIEKLMSILHQYLSPFGEY